NGACQSGLCSAGVCTTTGKRQDGAACAQNTDCLSGHCLDRVCDDDGVRKLSDASSCGSAAECEGGFCNGGLCASAPGSGLGDSCDNAQDCDDKPCVDFGDGKICTEGCVSTCSRGGFACFQGQCTPIDYCEEPSGNGEGPGCTNSGCESCDADATCSDASGTFQCICNPGFAGNGESCDADNCSPDPCLNGATCVDGDDVFSCTCLNGFTGNRCEQNINDCPQINPCQNGGSCVDGIASYTCSCASGYGGDLCEVDIDECVSGPCENGGTCVDGAGSYSCTCPSGFAGTNCEVNINDCPASNPCENGGTCVDGINTFTCSCQPGFSGSFCATNIDDCVGNPCQNGGVCTDGVNSFTCNCTPGWSGPTCGELAPCSSDLDCAESQFCNASNFCEPDGCTPLASRCVGDEVVECEANGSQENVKFTCPGRPNFQSVCVSGATQEAFCSCDDDWDCPQYTECEVDRCVGTGVEPTCSLPPEPFENVLPTNEITWGGVQGSPAAVGSPFPDSAQVVLTPSVANLDDDNGDGLIDERDFPEIIFMTFCNSAGFRDDGILRAIHGGGPDKGKDFFATCGNTVWHEGEDPSSVSCSCNNNTNDADLNPTAALAVADLDYDGVPEIVATVTVNSPSNYMNRMIRIFDNTGEIILTSPQYDLSNNNWAAAVTVANIDNAGFAEIVVGNDVFTFCAALWVFWLEDHFVGLQPATGNHFWDPSPVSPICSGMSALKIVQGSVAYSLDAPPVPILWQIVMRRVLDRRGLLPSKPTATASCGSSGMGAMMTVSAPSQMFWWTLYLTTGRKPSLDGMPEVVLINNGEL
ncbi:MAG: hypothetical protein R3C68_08120, partial [Myxococcota bacterium]